MPLLQRNFAECHGAGLFSASGRPAPAQAQLAAITKALLKTLERFSSTRDLIELAYADQVQMVAPLTPPGKPVVQPMRKMIEAGR